MEKIELEKKIELLNSYITALKECNSYREKINYLDQLEPVKDYLAAPMPIHLFMNLLTDESEYAIKSVIAIGQGPNVFNFKYLDESQFKKLIILLEQLLDIEIFYQFLGGIIGYHNTLLKLILEHYFPEPYKENHLCYIQPEGLDLKGNTEEVKQIIRLGIESLHSLGIIFPVGGAGDRLNLRDESTGEALPAALLPFLGKTLLDLLIRDVQGEEYLAYKLLNQQFTTPIALMTSVEKNNHIHILEIFKKNQWFGRSPKDFFFFIQPLVPVITIDGNWSLSAPLTLTLKPSGHGVLWKLAEESGVFTWFKDCGRVQCLVRQINNPVAGTDQGLLALIGMGCSKNKAFGFLSCERLLNADEGTNVLIEKQDEKAFEYTLTNIEYTEFAIRGIGEIPAKEGSPYSIYPTNTNLLFANIDTIQKILKKCPLPGQLVNMKSNVPYLEDNGNISYLRGGRLESTMQNIADSITDTFSEPLKKEQLRESLKSFILFNDRSKTISTTKKSYKKGENPVSTPEQAYYDMLYNHYRLLEECQFDLPAWQSMENYLQKGPSLIFLFHPALGPLYTVIRQKIRKGKITHGSELQLEIAEADIEDLHLQGSLLVEGSPPFGYYQNQMLKYCGGCRCSLHRVTIDNQGIDRAASQFYWKNKLTRNESVKIILHEGAEFHAEDVTLKGNQMFEVPPFHRMVIHSNKKECTPIEKPSWSWNYAFNAKNDIILTKKDQISYLN